MDELSIPAELDSAIAIVGMAGRFAGADTVDELWKHVRAGENLLGRYSDQDLERAGVPTARRRDPNYVPVGGDIERMKQFDAALFGIGPRDAMLMDPQHRQFLECAWTALEAAGHAPDHFNGAVGIFAGSGQNTYLQNNILTNPDLVDSLGMFLIRHTGNDKDFLSTHTSYRLNLRGPSVNIQTACSTSLVAIHLATQSLLGHECDMALAGGVTLNVPAGEGYLYREGEVLSQDGVCRPFSEGSSGTVLTSGVGVVVLRRLADAVADGDQIFAVVRGSAVNNDGAGKSSFFAPTVDGHAAVVAEALAVAGVDAETVTYLESHGTGTRLGDPIEVEALTHAFRESTNGVQFAALGSTKANIGHTDTAAGVAGIMKVAQAMRAGEIPPLANFTSPNTLTDLDRSPFYVPTEVIPWSPPAGTPRRAGVSSLGVGGTNAHVVLEEWPHAPRSGPSKRWQLLPLSAASKSALGRVAEGLGEHLGAEPGVPLADVAHTLQVGRTALSHRRIVVASSHEEAVAQLTASASAGTDAEAPASPAPVAFMFPGGGSHHVGMARGLYESEPVFRAHVDECAALLASELDVDLRAAMYGDDPAGLDDLEVALPAIFVTDYALAKLWESWGIVPEAMIGHSLGEYVAATLAGVFQLKDALSLVVTRGRLVKRVAGKGLMLAVSASESVALEHLGALPSDLTVGTVNAPNECVLSGSPSAVQDAATRLTAAGIEHREVLLSAAAHSPLLDPILGEFEDAVRRLKLSAPTRRFISDVTGTWITSAQACDPAYWASHLRQTVRFSDGVRTLLEAYPEAVLVEVGPGQSLRSYAMQQNPRPHAGISSLRHRNQDVDDARYLMESLGAMWVAGVAIDWKRIRGDEVRARVSLPTYPFEPVEHWIDRGVESVAQRAEARSLDRIEDLSSWFSRPLWVPAPLARRQARLQARERWLLFVDGEGVGDALATRLRELDQDVIVVYLGDETTPFVRRNAEIYQISPGAEADYQQLFDVLAASEWAPDRVVHLGGLMEVSGRDRLDRFERVQDRTFYSLLHIAQALTERVPDAHTHLGVVSRGMQRTGSEATTAPEQATLLGPCRVIPREYPSITCQSIDLELPRRGWRGRYTRGRDEEDLRATIEALILDLANPGEEATVAYRHGERLVQTLSRVELDAPAEDSTSGDARVALREHGTYLITGGFGGIGAVFARYLATSVKARLALVGRTSLPDRASWDAWVEAHPRSDATSERIALVRELEALGAQVLPLSADVSDLEEMRAAVARVTSYFGHIDGVIHAAGVLDDGLIATKERARARAVIAPKAHGAIVLSELLQRRPPAFTVFCSSTSALLGVPGQVDYVAANAFLDAFAQQQTALGQRGVISVDWGLWREVGLSARQSVDDDDIAEVTDADGPVLGTLTSSGEGEFVFETSYSPSSHWFLDEHRVASGTALVPGSHYVELARAAAAHVAGDHIVEIENLSFLAPLQVPDGGHRTVRVRLEAGSGRFRVMSAADPTNEASFELHAEGFVRGVSPVEVPSRCSVDKIRDRCRPSSRQEVLGRQETHLRFGPRWANLQEVWLGQDEVFGRIELPPAYAADLQRFGLHPAMLDIATGLGLPLLEGYASCNDLFVPLSYGRVRVHDALPARFFTHIRPTEARDIAAGVVSFDVALLDDDGRVLVEVESFSLRRIGEASRLALSDVDEAPRRATGESAFVAAGLPAAITPGDGVEALRRVLSAPSAQMVVSSIEVDRLRSWLDHDQRRNTGQAARVARPTLEVEFEAASNPVEQQIAEWWQELLNLSSVGVHDDFFQIGGHSLIALRLFALIKQHYRVDIGLAALFDSPTVAKLAALVQGGAGDFVRGPSEDAESGDQPWPCLVPIKPAGTHPPLFCVHGAKGNVLIFRDLAQRLSPEQPFYGLQMQGVNGVDPFHTSIQEMAAHYVEEMRGVQPVGPYYLAGYSGGGLIALEMARQLKEVDQKVAMVLLVDAPAPDYTRMRSFPWFQLRSAEAVLQQGPSLLWERLRGRWYWWNWGRGRPSGLSFNHMDSVMAGHQASRFDGYAVLLRVKTRVYPADLGWNRWITRGIESHDVSGTHESMWVAPHVDVLVRLFENALARARSIDAAERASAAETPEDGASDPAPAVVSGLGRVG
ncbi:MAG: SDR family NAD(P)-dependent oxidoreductase [Dehalococcoidia bacterium]|nr:SDR family NAD(P)-dependent oxidoreductase [Dehalococcoidia bacterium]